MEGIEWSRLIAPLLPGLHSPSVSKLPSADCQPPSTLSGHSFNPLENRLRQKNTKIYLPTPFYGINFCSFDPKPERLRRPQAGVSPPCILGPIERSAEGTKDLSPFQGFRAFGYPIPGVLPPSVIFSPLRGFLSFNVNDRIISR